MTGFNLLPPGLHAKRLQLLKEALPNVSRVAVLRELGALPDTIASDVQAAGSAMGLEVVHLEIRTPEDGDAALQGASRAQAQGLLNAGGPIVANARPRVAALAAKYRLPIQQPTKFDFVINLQAAQVLGLTMPPSVVAHATEVLQ
jgi:putative tryptophan/tyrosine transport system substrate-binding protein